MRSENEEAQEVLWPGQPGGGCGHGQQKWLRKVKAHKAAKPWRGTLRPEPSPHRTSRAMAASPQIPQRQPTLPGAPPSGSEVAVLDPVRSLDGQCCKTQ